MNNLKIQFWKIHSGGNDFICIDNRDEALSELIASDKFSDYLIKFCKRGLGIGADGVIFAEKATIPEADIQARFFEPDGSEVELCGNGTACFVHWVIKNSLVKHPQIAIQTKAGINNGQLKENGSCGVCLPNPYNMQRDLSIAVDNKILFTDFIVTGTGHSIIFIDDVDAVNVPLIGPAVRHHKIYGQPTNANFTQLIKEGHLKVRTFEFGVEAETLACGTGSASAAMLAAVRFNWDRRFTTGQDPVLVDVKGGDQLKIWFNYDADSNSFTDVCLEANPKPVYQGEIFNNFLENLEK